MGISASIVVETVVAIVGDISSLMSGICLEELCTISSNKQATNRQHFKLLIFLDQGYFLDDEEHASRTFVDEL